MDALQVVKCFSDSIKQLKAYDEAAEDIGV